MTAPGEEEDSGTSEPTDETVDTDVPPARTGSADGVGERLTGTDETQGEGERYASSFGSGESIERAEVAGDEGGTLHNSQAPSEPGQDDSASNAEEETWKLFARDVVTSVLAVALLGLFLFAMSGVWPPMVAIESGSMEPNMNVNDLVFLMENERFQPSEAQAGTGVVTAAVGSETGYGSYGDSGDVIVFAPGGDENTTPIIHRAMFWVEEGENWCERAESGYLGSLQPDDEACTASNDGFITKGDNNDRYDQASLQADDPVKPEWVVGTAEVRVPGLGWFRLQFQ